MEYTISTHNGSVIARGHNIRDRRITDKEEHIDPNGIHEVWRDQTQQAAYREIFGDALAKYNAKQQDPSRRIRSYYRHIEDDMKKHTAYEMIIQIGSKDNAPSPELGRQIMREWVDAWESRNPSLRLIGAYYHADEDGAPHVHCDYIPVATGYTRGLETQTGLVKALGQQGYHKRGKVTAQIAWEHAQNRALEEICNRHGLTIVHPDEGKGVKHVHTATYKTLQDAQGRAAGIVALARQEAEKIEREAAGKAGEAAQIAEKKAQEAEGRRKATESTLKTLEGQIEEKSGDLADLEGKLQEAQTKLQEAEAKAQEIERDAASKAAEASIEATLAKARQEQAEQAAQTALKAAEEAEGRRETAESAVKALEGQIEAKSGNLVAIGTKLAEAQTKLQECEAKAQEIERAAASKAAEASTEATLAKVRQTQAEAAAQTALKAAEEAEGRRETAESAVKALEGQIEAKSGNLVAIGTKLAEAQTKLQESESEALLHTTQASPLTAYRVMDAIKRSLASGERLSFAANHGDKTSVYTVMCVDGNFVGFLVDGGPIRHDELQRRLAALERGKDIREVLATQGSDAPSASSPSSPSASRGGSPLRR